MNWVTFSACSLGIPTITNHTHIWLTTPIILDHTHILAWPLQMCSLRACLIILLSNLPGFTKSLWNLVNLLL